MSILGEIIAAKKLEFDALREIFYPESPVCYLLAGDGDEEVFSVKLEISGGWYLDTKQKKLLVAAPDTDFAKKLELSGYFSVSGRVYELQDDDGEGGDGKVPPEGEEPWWKLSYKRTGQSFSPE
ncbi:MAG TPA: hypothetical protein VGC76_14530 [Pyrinomonadaceae bacterium]|jgi:hypothetical protein